MPHDWAKQPGGAGKIAENQKLRERAQAVFDASKRSYGSRRLSDGLKKAGFPVGRYKARRVMAELDLKPRYPKRFKATTDSNHNDAIAPNLLDRKFNVAKPNQVWTTDTGAPCGYHLCLDIGRLALCTLRGINGRRRGFVFTASRGLGH